MLGATYCALDGHASPESVVQGYASGARAHGAVIRTGAGVTGIRTAAGRVTGVVTDDGVVETDTVVCTAGAWSREVAAMAGVDAARHPRAAARLVHGAGTRPAPGAADDSGLLDRLLLPPGGARPAIWHGRPRPAAGVRPADARRLAGACGRGDGATRSGDAGDGRRRRLDRLLRGHPRPQRADRPRRGGRGVRLRHRLLGPRLPAEPGGRRDPARPRAGPRSRSSTWRRSPPRGSAAPRRGASGRSFSACAPGWCTCTAAARAGRRAAAPRRRCRPSAPAARPRGRCRAPRTASAPCPRPSAP